MVTCKLLGKPDEMRGVAFPYLKGSRNTPRRFMLKKTRISSSWMDHLALVQS